MTHLNTSFLVDLLREAGREEDGPATGVLDRLADEELGVSVHVVCELQAGAELAGQGERVPTLDLLIGTSAIAQPAPLVTRKAAGFDRIPGLQVLSY